MRPDEVERHLLCQIVHRALVEIRTLTFQGNSQQAYDLADAVHNIPVYLDSPQYDRGLVLHSLRLYQSKYPRPSGERYFDYLALLGDPYFAPSVDSSVHGC